MVNKIIKIGVFIICFKFCYASELYCDSSGVLGGALNSEVSEEAERLHQIGSYYYLGVHGCSQDYKKAYEYFIKSANQNNANAQLMR